LELGASPRRGSGVPLKAVSSLGIQGKRQRQKERKRRRKEEV
jgi:hypothetical protein